MPRLYSEIEGAEREGEGEGEGGCGSPGPHEGDFLPGLDGERKVAQDDGVGARGVGEGYVAQLDSAPHRLRGRNESSFILCVCVCVSCRQVCMHVYL